MKHKKESSNVKDSSKIKNSSLISSSTDSEHSNSPKSDYSGNNNNNNKNGHQTIVNRLMAHSQYIPTMINRPNPAPQYVQAPMNYYNKLIDVRPPPSYDFSKIQNSHIFDQQPQQQFQQSTNDFQQSFDFIPRNAGLFNQMNNGQISRQQFEYQSAQQQQQNVYPLNYSPKETMIIQSQVSPSEQQYIPNGNNVKFEDSFKSETDFSLPTDDSFTLYPIGDYLANQTFLDDQSRYSDVSSPPNDVSNNNNNLSVSTSSVWSNSVLNSIPLDHSSPELTDL